jgi:hypothetical protein
MANYSVHELARSLNLSTLPQVSTGLRDVIGSVQASAAGHVPGFAAAVPQPYGVAVCL